MNAAQKYANLPDIDTAQDVYETPDIVGASDTRGESSDEDTLHHSRSRRNGVMAPGVGPDELDTASFISPEDASKHFRQRERRRERTTAVFAYPPSPTSPSAPVNVAPLSQRLNTLRAELASLEIEFADPANPLLAAGDADPGEMIRDLVDVRSRLEKLSSRKEGRERLIELIASQGSVLPALSPAPTSGHVNTAHGQDDMSTMGQIDKRLAELEKVVGSSSASLDEASPLPAPLLPTLNRLSAQLTLLTQPRHIDSISRRLKLLLTDLERASAASAGTTSSSRRQASQSGAPATGAAAGTLQSDMATMLTRLSPHLPTLPHILTRLRTLSALHTSAAAFQTTLETLEEEQKQTHTAFDELTQAVERVEVSFADNDAMTAQNVKGLETRLDALMARLESLAR